MPNDFGWAVTPPPPSPPTTLWPGRTRPEFLVDQQGIMLADPQNSIVGFDQTWGPGSPLTRIQYAVRSGTRDL